MYDGLSSRSVDGGLTTVAESKGQDGPRIRTLLTNGKFQGNNAPTGEVQAQIGFTLAPLLHTPERGHALVIGYGVGGSAHTMRSAGFRQIDVVDFSADIFRLANQYFSEVNDRVSTKRNVNAYVTDGRNFLLLHPRQYDVISMEITSIWFAGGGSLYNQEFYRLAKRCLKPDEMNFPIGYRKKEMA